MARVAAVWVVINLTWPEADNQEFRDRACVVLRQEGVVGLLEGMRGDEDLEIRNRVACALDQVLGDTEERMDTDT